MSELSLVVLTANSKDGAAQALVDVKGLDRDGWIELIDYSLASKDEKGRVTVREMDDERWEKVAAVGVGASVGVVSGALGGPMGALAGATAGALAGVGSTKLMEKIVQDTSPKGFPESLESDSSALAVIVEERYAERLDEELQKLGETTRRELKRAERDAEVDAYLRRSKDKIRSIQDDLHAQGAKIQAASDAEKAKIAADVAAKRAELESRREKLEDQIQAASDALKADIREMNFRLELAGLTARSGIATGIDHLQRQLNRYNDELEDLIHDQIDALKTEISELQDKAAHASGDAKAATEAHLLAVRSRLNKQRSRLQAAFEERLLQLKQWFENLQVRSALARADVRDKLQASIVAAQHTLAELKARLRTRNREDERAWADIRQGFNRTCKELEDAFDQASQERA
jgi:uncharacterized membrane protein